MFEELRIELDRARDAYDHATARIDRKLAAAVSLNPKRLKAAKELQSEYGKVRTADALAAAEQPADPEPKAEPTDEPKADAKGKKKTSKTDEK